MKQMLLENKKLLIIIIIVLLLSISGLTLAYFVGQIGPAATTNVNLTTKTVDNLTFTTGNDITIGPVNQANFAQGSGNKSGSTTASATLKANTGNNSATETYNVYLRIKHNNMVYTTNEKTPELKLKVTSPTGTITETDITETNGLIPIASNYQITTTSTKTDTWQVEVIFVNLNSDQQKNSGRSFAAKVIIQKDEYINGYLKSTTDSTTEYFGYSLAKSEVETINIEDNIEIPSTATIIGDVSYQQNGSIMMWYTDTDNDDLKELYIGQLGGVIANANSSCLFYEFRNVTEINGLENLDTSKVTTMSYMFRYSVSLVNLDLTSFNTSNVTNMSSMFSGSASTINYMSLENIKGLENFDTSKVNTMGYMFYCCVKLSNINISSFNTSNVTNMSAMFSGLNVTEIDISNFDTSKVTNMSALFYGTSKLNKINFGNNFNTSNVTSMYRMFTGTAFEELDLRQFNTNKVQDMSEMFMNMSNLKTIYVSSSFITTAVTSSENMFKNDTMLLGGAGTNYNDSYIDKTYARIDGGTNSPGYFTFKS